MLIAAFGLLAGVLLAFANGANDNFKGVATLYGSGTTSYRTALAWATVTTACGSLLAVWLARELLQRFSGKGIIPDELAADGVFGISVAMAAGLTVLLASRLGFPISTTHALVGAIIGAATASLGAVNWTVLGTTLVVPLLLSPFIAIAAAFVIYPMFHRLRLAVGVEKEMCLCVGQEVAEVAPSCCQTVALARAEELSVSLGTPITCEERYAGQMIGFDVRKLLDGLHFLSAGMVSFARGLNDTPKIAAFLLIVPAIESFTATIVCGLAMAVGGWVGARRIAETLSHHITEMNVGQGFSANLVTAVLVTSASRWGLPVSTTHVSCGALFGIGSVTGQAHWPIIFQILLAWITTLPCAALIAWLLFHLLS